MTTKTIPIEYFKLEFEGLRTNICADIALARYMYALQGDIRQDANDWAGLLRGSQLQALDEYGFLHPLGAKS